MTPPDDGPDPLVALFHRDATAHVQTLADGLARLAVDPGRVEDLPALERTARQIKGSALIVGVTTAADLGRAVEDAFAAARAGGLSLTAARVTALLAAVDAIKEVADAAADESRPRPAVDRIAAVFAKLSADNGEPAPAVAPLPPAPPLVVVRPPAPPQPPAPPALIEPHAASLLDLFREEVRALCGVLGSGIVDLEGDAPDPRKIEPLMRASHSMKGAARIVGCDPAVDVAHVMEEFFVAVQKGALQFAPGNVDTLLAAVDLLAELAETDIAVWAADNAGRAAESVGAIRAILNHETVAAPPPSPRTPPPPATSPPVAVPVPEQAHAAPATVAAKISATPIHLPPPPVEPEPPAKSEVAGHDGKDRVVRISALSLTRLLGLAGESLIEARWLQPFARSLLKLKKHQDHLGDVIEDVIRATGGNSPTGESPAGLAGGRIRATAEDARKRLVVCRQILAERVDEFETHARRSDDLNSRLYREVIASRMRPFGDGTHGLARMVRDVAKQLGKKVRFEVAGNETDVDRDILDKLEAPLGHMLRNALDHGLEFPAERVEVGKPESGTLRVEARHHAGTLNITVTDDGRGIDLEQLRRKVVDKKLTSADMASRLSDAELLDFLFLPGFSTADTVTDISGRGVGLDVVQALAQGVGGAVRLTTRLGHGTTFELQLPITLSVVRAVLVRIAGDPYALPLNRTDRLLRLPTAQVRTLEGKPHFEADGRQIGLVPAHLVFDQPAPEPGATDLSVALIGDRANQYGLIVDGFLGEQDLVVRPLDPRLGKVPNVAAAALLEDGSPVLIVDVDDMIRSVSVLVHEGKLRYRRPSRRTTARQKRVLVVDDSAIVREVERQMLQGKGYEVDVAVDGADGWNAVRGGGYDLIVSDIDMPRMTGLDLVRTIRSDPKTQALPVVIVSYKDRKEDRDRGLEVGANYYLTKSSFHDGRFIQAIEDLIGGSHAD
ncbi:response regulator [Fimbriiglobus ruber]|uniref:histidine kinase n=1 Tax=Fimbriiglobus ruber TaxID=1908690 RepID=A0A225D1C4_9BACT|nr:response regulator [Fimbriiglobus ruber]OWK34733.1 Signal transduction histidine kinase CheA [Fimbriiglobus ruber]